MYDVIILVTKHPLLLLYHCSLYCVKCYEIKLIISTWNVLNVGPFVMSRHINVSFNVLLSSIQFDVVRHCSSHNS